MMTPTVPWGTTGYVYWPAALIIASTSLLSAPTGHTHRGRIVWGGVKRVFSLLLVVTAIRTLMA